MHLYPTLKGIVLTVLFFFLHIQLPVNCAEKPNMTVPATQKTERLFHTIKSRLTQTLGRQEFSLGNPVFLRVFKIPGTVELWGESGERFIHLATYPICSFSGYPGPKRYEGDRQSPEGFYTIHPGHLNPNSRYHLSFDIGFPNTYDTSHGYTGSDIMIHGGCSSSGCFAVGNRNIEELYFAVSAAFNGGQEAIAIHIFPFALTTENLEKFSHSPWIDFWRSLAPMYGYFEQHKNFPSISLPHAAYAMGTGATDRAP